MAKREESMYNIMVDWPKNVIFPINIKRLSLRCTDEYYRVFARARYSLANSHKYISHTWTDWYVTRSNRIDIQTRTEFEPNIVKQDRNKKSAQANKQDHMHKPIKTNLQYHKQTNANTNRHTGSGAEANTVAGIRSKSCSCSRVPIYSLCLDAAARPLNSI